MGGEVLPVGGGYKVGTTIRFQSTAGGNVIRYFWDFGDGTSEDGKTEVDKAYSLPGNDTVSHVCTASSGAQSVATLGLSIVP